MKRQNGLIQQIASPENIRFAAWKAAKGKRYKAETMAWFADMDFYVPQLREQILEGKVAVGDYHFFKIYEPKERQICAAPFKEQVLHHALMHICHDTFEAAQIFDSYASRKGKGIHAALKRAAVFSKKNTWFLKLDIRKFFASVPHDILFGQLERKFKEKRLLAIFEAIIDSYDASTGRGLPIGNLTSQYFANHFLTALDHFIKEKLKVNCYVRYMDDLVLWAPEKTQLKVAFLEIKGFVESILCMELKPEQLNRCALGLPFLGYRIFPNQIRLLQKSKQRFFRKMGKTYTAFENGIWTSESCQRRAYSLLAVCSHADAAAGMGRIDVY